MVEEASSRPGPALSGTNQVYVCSPPGGTASSCLSAPAHPFPDPHVTGPPPSVHTPLQRRMSGRHALWHSQGSFPPSGLPRVCAFLGFPGMGTQVQATACNNSFEVHSCG